MVIALGDVENQKVHSVEPKQSLDCHQLLSHAQQPKPTGFIPTITVIADGHTNENALSELKK